MPNQPERNKLIFEMAAAIAEADELFEADGDETYLRPHVEMAIAALRVIERRNA